MIAALVLGTFSGIKVVRYNHGYSNTLIDRFRQNSSRALIVLAATALIVSCGGSNSTGPSPAPDTLQLT